MSRRLLQAMAGAPHGGAELFFVRLAGALQRAGEAQRVLIRRDPARRSALLAAGIEVGEARFGGPCDLASRLAFRREIAAWRPNLVLTWMSRATAFCPRGDFVHAARLGGYYDLKYYRDCDHLIANTEAIVDYAVERGWPRDRVHYLPNFVPDPAVASAGSDATLPERPAGAPLLLALGRLHPNKGFDLLLEALAAIPEPHLWLAGDGPLRSDLEAQAARLGLSGRVHFLGWRDDTAVLFAAADLLVCPSRIEPLGNVVIEAWAAGVPVVATASDGPAALIEHGATGLLTPLGDAAALADAIAAICRDTTLRSELAAAGRQAYETRFTEAAVVAAYRQFFDRVAA
jgi:glycosyltransferase involved in cell wall biosynthesis